MRVEPEAGSNNIDISISLNIKVKPLKILKNTILKFKDNFKSTLKLWWLIEVESTPFFVLFLVLLFIYLFILSSLQYCRNSVEVVQQMIMPDVKENDFM